MKITYVKWKLGKFSREFTIIRMVMSIVTIFGDCGNLMLSYYERHSVVTLPNTEAGVGRRLSIICKLCGSVFSYTNTVIFILQTSKIWVRIKWDTINNRKVAEKIH